MGYIGWLFFIERRWEYFFLSDFGLCAWADFCTSMIVCLTAVYAVVVRFGAACVSYEINDPSLLSFEQIPMHNVRLGLRSGISC